MTVRPGQLDGFKKQAAECIRLTRDWLSPSRCGSGCPHHYMESGMLRGVKERAEGTLGAA